MSRFHLKRGYDIKLEGAADSAIVDAPMAASVAIKPTDFHGMVARPEVAVGDAVKVGSPLLHDKEHQQFLLTSPVSGTVTAVERGARRAIQHVLVEPDGKQDALAIDAPSLGTAERDKVLDTITRSGLFAAITQRPLAVAPDPRVIPRDIFVPAMDSAPLAADQRLLLRGNEAALRSGLHALSRLTTGHVHVCTGGELELPEIENVDRVLLHEFLGPHPAGNPGVHIHHIAPIANRGDAVWVCPLQAAILIGKLFDTGQLVPEVIVAATGSAAARRTHVRTVIGARLDAVTSSAGAGPARFISGNPLTGREVGVGGYLCFMHTSVTVLPEHDGYRLLGWAMPGFAAGSRSRTFMSTWLRRRTSMTKTTELGGGERAFIATGIYQEVLPMDVHPEFLMKSILADDIPEMEGLGIYELAEEDVALCEYICPSKIRWQYTLRRGLDLIGSEA